MAIDKQLRKTLDKMGIVKTEVPSVLFSDPIVFAGSRSDVELRAKLGEMGVISYNSTSDYIYGLDYEKNMVEKLEKVELILDGIINYLGVEKLSPMIPLVKSSTAKKEA